MEYDGIVLESWSRWAAYGILHDPDMRNMVNNYFNNNFIMLPCLKTCRVWMNLFLTSG